MIASLIFIPFQAAAEEIVFRGYMNQAIASFVRNRWVVFIITSAIFAAFHGANPEVTESLDKGWLSFIDLMATYFFFGFILSVIVYFEGGLEAVIGVHIINNLFAAVILNYEGSVLPTPTIFLTSLDDAASNLPALLVLILVGFVLFKTRGRIPQLDEDRIILKPAAQHP